MPSKVNKKLVYTLMAVFSIYSKPNSQVLSTFCEVAEEATGEPFSTEVLEETIKKISIEVSLEDKIEVAKTIQKFLSTMKLANEK